MFTGIKGIIFDLDGTLVDSMWMWKEIDQEFLGKYGLSCPQGLDREIEGCSFTETAVYFKNRFKLAESIEEIKSIWIKMSIEKYRNHVYLKEGVAAFLMQAQKSGIKMGIATSNGREMVDAVIDSRQIRSYFQTIVTGCEVAKGKPAPDIYLKAASNLNLLPSVCLVFEDVTAGILAGKRAGMKVCAVEDPYSELQKDEKIKNSDYYIKSFAELKNRMGAAI